MRIIMIDDIMMNILVMKQAAKSLGTVDGFQDTQAGLAAIRDAYQRGEPYDLLFLDILMPTRNGLEVLKDAQALGAEFPPTNRTKVVMVTSSAERESFTQAMHLGAAGYILKPFQPTRILDEVHRLMEGRDRSETPGA
jgi:DNA-binding NarL/FixJ family response regulator